MVILLPLVRLKIDLCWKVLNPKKVSCISKINSAKASTDKCFGKPLPGNKYFGIDPDIRFYEIEDVDNNEEVENT